MKRLPITLMIMTIAGKFATDPEAPAVFPLAAGV